MYIQIIKSKSKDKEYTSVVLAKNYREDGKVKQKILAPVFRTFLQHLYK